MGEIISRPDGPLAGFAKGAGAAFLLVGLPVMIRILFFPASVGLWRKLEIGGGMTAIACLVAGCCLALWRLIQAWAYNHIVDDPYRH